MKERQVKVYIHDREIKMGFFSIWKEMIIDMLRSRELIWRLFLRDFNAKYKQSALGVLWAVIMPLVVVGIFVYLNRGGVLNIGDIDVPYPVFALFGLSVWTLFATGLTATSNSLVKAGSMIVKINFPKETLVIAAMGGAIVEFLVRLALLCVVFFIYKIFPHWTCLLLPLALMPLFLFTLGLGFILSLVSGILRDVPNIVVIMTTFLMFICPVAYPIPKVKAFVVLNQWNPLAHLISASRDLVFKGAITDPRGFIWSSIFAFLVFAIGWKIFHVAQPKIAERV
ncbi:ABC transporter permease [Candidatus Omnitrophota bacterium]